MAKGRPSKKTQRRSTDQAAQQAGAPPPGPAAAAALARPDDIGQTCAQDGRERPSFRSPASLATITPAFVAVFFALYFAQDVLIPIAIAALLYLVLLPTARLLFRLRLPRALASMVMVLTLMAACLAGFFFLSGAASSWLDRMPQIMYEIENKLEVIKAPMERVKKASDDIEEVTKVDGGKAGETKVVVEQPSLLDRFLSGLRDVGIQAGIIFILLYFLFTSGDIFREKLIKVTPARIDRRRVLTIWRQVEKDVSTYLFTIALINVGLGAAVALAMFVLGMPNPMLWGAMATFLNFIPYLGAVVGVGVISVVAVVSFASLQEAMLPPLAYLVLTAIEAQLVTPTVLGRSLTLNPVVIFVTLILWGWLWGIAGTLVAVPLLVTAKVVCENVDPWNALGEFLSGRQT